MRGLHKRSLIPMKVAFIAGAIGISMLSIGQARASATLVTFNPDSIPGVTGLSPFQADNYNLGDFTTATITNATGSFTQSGTLDLLDFFNGSTMVPSSVSGLQNGSGSNSYGLFMTFTATGYVGVAGGAFVPGSPLNQGYFTNISYSLIADPGATDTVTSSGTLVNHGAADVTLATGGVASSGVDQVSVDIDTPSADVLLSIVKSALGSSFFSSPADLSLQELVHEHDDRGDGHRKWSDDHCGDQ